MQSHEEWERELKATEAVVEAKRAYWRSHNPEISTRALNALVYLAEDLAALKKLSWYEVRKSQGVGKKSLAEIADLAGWNLTVPDRLPANVAAAVKLLRGLGWTVEPPRMD